MPCDSISTAEIDAGKFSGPHLLAALTALGLNPRHEAYKTYTFAGGTFRSDTGKFTFTGGYVNDRYAAEKTAQIKRAYSAEVLKSQAKRFGWQLKQTGPQKYVIQKRA
jgi:hypothetical protein